VISHTLKVVRQLWLLALLCLCALVSAADFHSDARLSKSISIHLKMAPLSVCVKEFATQTGVGIYVTPNIKERKVTLIFKDRPAAEAMEMLAKTMFCEWSSESGGYRLEMTHEVINEEIGLLAEEDKVLKERLAAVIEQIRAVAATPKEELIQERDKMNADLDRLRYSRDPAGQKEFQQIQKDRAKFNWFGWWEVGFALRNAPSVVDTLAAGTTVFASTGRGQALPLPLSAVPGITAAVMVPGADGQMHSELRSATGAVGALRCNPVTGDLEWRSMATGLGPGASGYSGTRASLLNSGDAENKLYNLPLRKRLRKWASTLDTQLLEVKLNQGPPPKSPGYMAQAFSVAEHLEYLAEAANIPVVADAYRLPASSEVVMDGTTVGDYVRHLRDQGMPGVGGGSFRTEKGWLAFRHPRFWRQLAAEIPESAFAPYEQKIKSGNSLSLEDYASFALELTPWQARVFPYRPALTRFPRLPLIGAMPALRLWGSLSGDQREAAYATGLPLAAMGGAQLGLYKDALTELLWLSHVNESFFAVLMGGTVRDDMGLFLQDGRNGAEPGNGGLQEAIAPQNGRTFMNTADIERMRRGAYNFVFGNSVQSGAVYNVQLSPRE
jgi:hypothetical protein